MIMPVDENNEPMERNKSTNRGTGSLPFQKILRSVMTERNLSVRKIAQIAEVKPTTVSNWLDGKNPHDLVAINKLAKGLGLSFKNLLLGEPEEIQGAKTISEIYEEQEFL
jgi:transcriptional regulator with XRE-family HTH domain